MKAVLLHAFFLISLAAQVSAQISFRNEIKQVPNATNRMQAAEIGDVSNDGRNDVVVGSVYYGSLYNVLYVIVYIQRNDGVLAEPIALKYSQSSETLYDLEIADVNNDKRNDIVLGMGSTLGIFYQLPTGGFSELKKVGSINASHGIKAADLNDDGLTDILGFQNSQYKIFLQTSTSEFSLTTIAAKQTNYTQIQVGDLNGDGLTDIANTYGCSMEIHYQLKGSGISNPISLFIGNINNTATNYPLDGFTIADLNNDGRQDIATASGGNSGKMKLFYQTAEGKIDTLNAKTYSTYDIPKPIRIADLNCDGDNEIIIGHDGWDRISIFNKSNLPDYSGGYTLYPSLYYFTPFGMAVGDINGDNRIDIIDVDQEAKMSILYNESKPLKFDRYERKADNVQVKKDTTTKVSIVYTPIVDAAKSCKRNNFRKLVINQLQENVTSKGDSLLIRYASMCGTAYCDTLRNSFNLSENHVLSCDSTESIENRDVLTATFNTVDFSSGTNQGHIQLAYNICWTIQADQDWIVPVVSSGKYEGQGEFMYYDIPFGVKANPTLQDRKATITIAADNGEPSYEYTIYQKGSKPVINTTTTSLILNENTFHTAHLLLWSTVNWTLSCNADWLTVDKIQGGQTTSDFDILSVKATPNTTDFDRNAVLTLTGDSNIVKKISVRQLKYGYNSQKNPNDVYVRLYPNPVKDKLYLEINPLPETCLLRLSDSRGRILFNSSRIAGCQSIDFSRYPKGLYLLRVIVGEKVVVEKILKN